MKLHRWLFWFFVLLLPVQFGRHFWPDWSQVLGLSIDYLSPTIYLTDLLILAILFSWFWEMRNNYSFFKIRNLLKKHWWILTVFLYLLVTSLLAKNPGVAFYKFIKIIEFVFLGFYIVKEKPKIEILRLMISGAVIYSSLIALIQFINQASIGGIFWWLGERDFNLLTPGIAKAILNGRLILRPYSTFPHPNVLAGFTLVMMILIVGGNEKTKVQKIFKWTALFLGGMAIIFSFSRSVWLVGLLTGLGFLFYQFFKIKKRTIINCLPVFLLVVAFLSLFYHFFTSPLSGQETIEQRISLAEVALKIIETHPWVGVGLNNFIPQLPFFWQQFGKTYWLQPVHNIFLLVAAELGLMGLIIFLWFLFLTFRHLLLTNRSSLILIVCLILVLGFFDHYWLTLQQTQLLFTIILGLSWSQ